MDLVYPIKPNRPDQPEELRYSLRTAWQHFSHDRVFIVGHMPEFLDRSKVHHIPSPQLLQSSLKFANQRANLEAVMASDVGEEFVWMNDDFFLLDDIESFPYYHRGPLQDYVDRIGFGDYAQGLRQCLKILGEWGYDDPNAYNVHAPLPVNKTRLIGVMETAWADGLEGGFMRPIYPVGSDLAPHEFIFDPKVKLEAYLPEGKVMSTSDHTWRSGPGKKIRMRYSMPSPYEVGS